MVYIAIFNSVILRNKKKLLRDESFNVAHEAKEEATDRVKETKRPMLINVILRALEMEK